MKARKTVSRRFLRDESGSVTVDWVALTAGTLLLGLVVVYAIFSEGVAPLVKGTSDNTKAQAEALAEISLSLGAETPADLFSIKGD